MAWIGIGWINGDARDGEIYAGPQGYDVHLLSGFAHRVDSGACVAPVAGVDGDDLPHRDAQRIGAEVHAVVGEITGWAIARRRGKLAIVAVDGDIGSVHREAIVVHIAVGTASWGRAARRCDSPAVVGQGVGCDTAPSLPRFRSQLTDDDHRQSHYKDQQKISLVHFYPP